MAATEERVTASCSICLKLGNEVTRLVAGPGPTSVMSAWTYVASSSLAHPRCRQG